MCGDMIREGRLGKNFDDEVAKFTSSLDFDRELFEHDILNDMAHLVMLTKQGIVGVEDSKQIFTELKLLLKEGTNALDFKPEHEDIHMAIESHLIKKVGDAGGKLHTARSRNDQVACDLRMLARDKVNVLSKSVVELISSMLDVAGKNTLTLIPAYTHLQHAQPNTLAHHILSHVDSLFRSLERLEDAYTRIDMCPLGAAAATTTSFPIDRSLTAELLGFSKVLENSIDAVSSRDYMVEISSVITLLSIDISKMCEELILWSTSEFGLVELDDAYSSTSSIMPQKKNPDVLEILRAKTANAAGNFVSLTTMLRSLPQSYNRDLQELSPIFFNGIETAILNMQLLKKIIVTVKIKAEAMNNSCSNDFSTATELADLLVREEGIPFRTAHQIVGAVVSKAVNEGGDYNSINSKLLISVASEFTDLQFSLSDEQIKDALTPLKAVESRKTLGGPSPKLVKEAIQKRFESLSKAETNVNDRVQRLSESKKQLLRNVDSILGV